MGKLEPQQVLFKSARVGLHYLSYAQTYRAQRTKAINHDIRTACETPQSPTPSERREADRLRSEKREEKSRTGAETQSNNDWSSRGRVLPIAIHGGDKHLTRLPLPGRASTIPHARKREKKEGKKKKEKRKKGNPNRCGKKQGKKRKKRR